MTTDIEELKFFFPKFPQITRENIRHLLRSSTNNHHKLLCKALDMLLREPDSSTHFYTLLASIPTPENQEQLSDVHVLAVHFWVEYLLNQFSEEIKPLHVLFPNNIAELYSPVQYSALLIMLLKRGVTAWDMIDSGVLHAFAQQNYYTLDLITMSYALFQKTLETETALPEAHTLLTLISEYSMEVRSDEFTVFVNMCLNGLQRPEQATLKYHAPATEFSYTPTIKNWHQLHDVFGFSWITQTLLLEINMTEANSVDSDDDEEEFILSEAISSMDHAQLIDLYRSVNIKCPIEYRPVFLQVLGALIPTERIWGLLQLKTELTWFLLERYLNEFTTQSEFELYSIITESPVTIISLNTLGGLCLTPFFKPYHSHLYRKIFDVALQHSAIINTMDEENLIDNLRNYPDVQEWCHSEDNRILAFFKRSIRSLTSEVMIALNDMYQAHTSKIQLLHALSLSKPRSPSTTHEFRAFIIEQIFLTDRINFDVSTIIRALHSGIPSERILLECLVYTHIPALQAQLLVTLDNDFDHVPEANQALGNFCLIEQALLNQNETFFQWLLQHSSSKPSDLSIEYALFKRIEHQASLTTAFSQHPHAFFLLLRQFPITQRLDYLSCCMDFICSQLIPRADLFRMAFDLLSEEQRPEVVHLEDYNATTLFARAFSYPDTLLVLLNGLKEEERFVAVTRPNSRHRNALQEWKSFSQITIILKFLPANQRLLALRNLNNSRSIIDELVRKNPSCLEIIDLLPEDDRGKLLILTNNRGQTYLHHAISNLELFHALQKRIKRNQLIKAMHFADAAGQSSWHILANEYKNRLKNEHIDLFMALLSAVPKTNRFNILNLVQKNGTPLLSDFTTVGSAGGTELVALLSMLPQRMRLSAIQSLYKHNNYVLHVVGSSQLYIALFNTLPQSDRLEAFKISTPENHPVLHDIALFYPHLLLDFLDHILPKKDYFNAITFRNKDGNNLLNMTKRPLSLEVLKRLPKKRRLAAISDVQPYLIGRVEIRPGEFVQKSIKTTAFLHDILHNSECLQQILATLPKNHLKKAALVDTGLGIALGQAVGYPQSFNLLIHAWPEEKRLEIIKQIPKQRVFSVADRCAVVLNALPNHHRLEALVFFHDDTNHATILHNQALHPDGLLKILRLLPESDRWLAIQLSADIHFRNENILQLASLNISSLHVLFETLPAEKWLAMSLQKTAYNQSIFNLMANDPQLKRQYCYVVCASYLQHLQSQSISDNEMGRLTLRKIGVIQYAQQLLLANNLSEEIMLQRFYQALKAPVSETDQRLVLTVRRDSSLIFFLKCLSIVFTFGYTYSQFFGQHATKGKELLDEIDKKLALTHSLS